ncbi:MAG: hypothetical protein QM490_04015, partial [Candidatus Gracilibacteria bacterium]
KSVEVEERYKELLDKYPDHVGIQEGYENFTIQSDDSVIMNYLEEIKILIAEGKNIEVEEKYKELLAKYPDNIGLKEGYENFKISGIEDTTINTIEKYLEEINILITAGENIKVEEKYKELIAKYPDNIGLKEGYENFKISRLENTDTNMIMNSFQEMEDFIIAGENTKVEEKYKELLTNFPDYIGLDEGYNDLLEKYPNYPGIQK